MNQIREFLRRYSFGMRTRKTALAVFICLALDFAMGHNAPVNACIAAILTMQATQKQSLNVGVQRLLGTAIGGVVGMLLVAAYTLYPHTILRIFLAGLGVMISISVCCAFKKPEAAAIAAILALIMVQGGETENTLLFAFMQMLETAMGVLVAMGVNRFVSKPREGEAEEDADVPAETEASCTLCGEEVMETEEQVADVEEREEGTEA